MSDAAAVPYVALYGALDLKEQAFVDEYLQCLNSAEAARRVWGVRSAKQKGYAVISRPDVAAAIAAGIRGMGERDRERIADRTFGELTAAEPRGFEALRDQADSRAAKANRAGRRNMSVHVRARVMERDDFRCRRCGWAAPDVRLVVDHIVPVVSGGTDDEANLQVLCVDCNAGKTDRDPHPHDLRGPRLAAG